jgi:cyclopropane fatty-acyl-phospholipid synthase-like methyltransferase
LSLESAFHYENRPLFFANVRQLLHDDGLFVITDILLQKRREEYTDVFSNTFLTIFGDFLCFPTQNMITLDRWTEQMEESGLQVVEKKIVTHLTFAPYYRHFFHVYCQNKGWSSWMANLLNFTFQSVQPFEYVIAVCKKREKELSPKK